MKMTIAIKIEAETEKGIVLEYEDTNRTCLISFDGEEKEQDEIIGKACLFLNVYLTQKQQAKVDPCIKKGGKK